MTNPNLKCYYVQEKSGKNQELIFAHKRTEAIYASEAYGMVDWIDIMAVRKPEFDQYAEQGFVPKEAMLEHGWWFECCGRNDAGLHCCNSLTKDDNPLLVSNHVYCNQSCYDNSNKSVEG